MNNEILRFCLGKGVLLDRDVCEVLSNINESTAKTIIERISKLNEKIITKSFFRQNANLVKEVVSGEDGLFSKLCITLGMHIEISSEIAKKEQKIENLERRELRNVKVLSSVMNKSKKITVEDFVKYLRTRILELRRVLQERPELENLVSINKMNGQRQGVSISGIVYNKRVTKNKNILLEIEDLTGKVSVLVNQNKPDVYEKAKDVVYDSVIGVRGVGNGEIIFANDIIYPEAVLREKTSLERDESAAFISDMHVGSKMFLEKNFLRFIDWINGESGDEKQKEEARKIKYLFIVGDTVDGIGVYPGQESLLDIKGVKEQYDKLAEYLGRIRKDVTMILSPGQHDAVRVAEPQPALDREYASALHELDNLILVSNPALVEITNNSRRGIKVLMYHGASMNSLINEVESLRTIRAHDTPSKVVKYILKIRHLAPVHSSVTYIPTEHTDDLAIREVPDIITTADLHRPDVDIYNNILIICNSCWQSITPFEEKVGNHPDPCKVPLLNLKTKAIKIVDFSESEEEKECKEAEGGIVCEV
jgi:DNA polymerase II small subunit